MLFQSAAGDGRIAVRSAFAQAALVDSDLFYASGFISATNLNDLHGNSPFHVIVTLDRGLVYIDIEARG
jgi:hypothetical protein